ncbi:hypothetical protein DICVIV_11634 [Dictyocaulus viviparus]|uniref:Uncharacterized protein n=1 Tax=Dictyocaulus viviparus TaxID=29172 RepID=A0A0D8XJ82_DICVI|nr:hypothetical protein DICVIV_11634 [Dictyocaulus viviparus]
MRKYFFTITIVTMCSAMLHHILPSRESSFKIKSYGYFDYKYFKPEYHVERFYAEEKHSNKYGSDERSSETKERKETNYSAKRLDEYHAKYGNNVAYYGNYKYENSRHPPSGDRLRNYGFHREGGQKESDRQIGEYDNRYYVPYNSNYYRNENDHTHHHTSNYRCGY